MKQLQEISECEFDSDSNAYFCKIGEKCNKNSIFYKAIIIYRSKKICLFIANDNIGIKPQFELFNNQLIVGNNDQLLVINLIDNTKKVYKVFPMFYQFIIVESMIIVIGELSTFCLLNNEIIWKNNFEEIIDFYSLEGMILLLKNYDSSIIKINITSGKIVS